LSRVRSKTTSIPILLSLLAGMLAPACRERAAPPPLTAALLGFADEATRELGLTPLTGDPPRRALRALIERARPVRQQRVGAREPDPIARAILDGEAGIMPDPVEDSIDRALLPRVLVHRRGSCLGLSAVYLAVAEGLGVEARGVIAPGHFFVRRFEAGAARDLELLEGGWPLALADLRRRYQVPPGNPLYLRALSSQETLAVCRYNLANALREKRRLREAVRHYLRVLEILPELAEAHLNLGLCYFRLGEHPRAERAYLRAAALNPGLRGLRGNLDALQRAWPRRDAAPAP
jgi:tetratricopeptide (TPR) repeat protein